MKFTCTKCADVKDATKFPYCKGRRHSWCRECNNFSKRQRRKDLRTSTKPRLKRILDDYLTPDGNWICSNCKVPKSTDNFSGRIGWCKGCRSKLEKDRRRKNGMKARPKTTIEGNEKSCASCHKFFTFDLFASNKRGLGGLSAYCKVCAKKKYYNPERAKFLSYKWREKNRSHYLTKHRIAQFNRKRKAKAQCDKTLTPEVVAIIYDQIICAYCKNFTPIKLRTIDHVIPLSKGGLHSIYNVTMCCKSCNSSKRDMEVDEFIIQIRNENDDNS